MTDFFDALASIPILVVVAAILLGLLCAGLMFVAFVSIPEREVSDLDGWQPYTAEQATLRHLEQMRTEKIRAAHRELRGH